MARKTPDRKVEEKLDPVMNVAITIGLLVILWLLITTRWAG